MRKKTFKIPESQSALPFRRPTVGLLSSATLLERRLLVSGVVLFALLSASYMYFLASSIYYVSARGETAQKIAALSAETAGLEAAYLARSLEMTEPYAKEKGLTRAEGQVFVEKAESLTVVDR